MLKIEILYKAGHSFVMSLMAEYTSMVGFDRTFGHRPDIESITILSYYPNG